MKIAKASEGQQVTYTPADADSCFVNTPIIGVSPLLVSHPMPWDIGAPYWEGRAPEVGRNKEKFLSVQQHDLLVQLEEKYGKDYDISYKKNQLSKYAEVFLRGHWLPGLRSAFPVAGFQAAIIKGASAYQKPGKSKLSKGKISAAVTVLGDDGDLNLTEIIGPFSLREDIGISSGMGKAPRLITRLEFATGWTANLKIKYNDALISTAQIAQLVGWSGDFGVGQWRPSAPNHPGQMGRYKPNSK